VGKKNKIEEVVTEIPCGNKGGTVLIKYFFETQSGRFK
jgi:hypothetical protein